MAATETLRVVENHARTYRRVWRGSIISTFLNPILYLAAMGVSLGVLVDQGSGREALDGFDYLTFLAPGLLAASAMQTGAGDAAWPVMAGIKWRRSYEAVLATPVAVRDLVTGHLLWVTIRLLMMTTIFSFVMVLFGATGVAEAVRAIIPAIVTGLAFGASVTAFSATTRDHTGLTSLFRFGIMPMFLFSGTFFPITQLPGWMQPVAYVTPLWHGVELTRAWALSLETTLPTTLHFGYLGLWIVIGSFLAARQLGKRMIV
jgi:lipooligosaccharide transport system permease protein